MIIAIVPVVAPIVIVWSIIGGVLEVNKALYITVYYCFIDRYSIYGFVLVVIAKHKVYKEQFTQYN